MVTPEETTVVDAPMERCFDLARSVEVPMACNVHFGEQAAALEGVTSGLLELDERVTCGARHFGCDSGLTSAITAMDRPRSFQDTMPRGAFLSMQHDHLFQALPDGRAEMKNVFRFAAPLGIPGRIAEVKVLRRYRRDLLRQRNKVMKQVAESEEWRLYLAQE